jgi:hypothetical protein
MQGYGLKTNEHVLSGLRELLQFAVRVAMVCQVPEDAVDADRDNETSVSVRAEGVASSLGPAADASTTPIPTGDAAAAQDMSEVVSGAEDHS